MHHCKCPTSKSRGHYITNPTNALLNGKSLKITKLGWFICFHCFNSSQKNGWIEWSLKRATVQTCPHHFCRQVLTPTIGEQFWGLHFSRVLVQDLFHCKSSILGHPYFWKHPYMGILANPLTSKKKSLKLNESWEIHQDRFWRGVVLRG